MRLRSVALFACLFGLAWLGQGESANAAGCGCPACVGMAQGPACDVGYQLVQRTIQVPTMVMEQRLINVTECRTEIRERQVLVRRVVPETQQVRDVYTVMVPQTQMRVERFRVCVPVWREVVQDVTVQVPSQEVRRGVRHVCRPVQVQEMQPVTRDVGHWEDVVVDVCQTNYGGWGPGMGCGHAHRRHACGGCGGYATYGDCGTVGYDAGCAPMITQQVQRVWKPQIVTEQVPVTVWRSEFVEEPFEYEVTVYRPEVRQQRLKVCEYVTQEKEREVPVTVCVPERREAVRNVTTYRTVAEPQVQRFPVQVPYTVQRQIDVPVCRLLPRTVTYRVPVPAPRHGGCGDCGGYGCPGCWH